MSLYEAEFESPMEVNEWELPGSSELESFETFEGSSEYETTELELANELLEVTSEAELEQFLGKLVRSVGRAASGLVRSPLGKVLGGVLKNVAKTALPMVGSAIGSFVAPGIGTAIGGKLGSMAGNLLEAEELEMLSEGEAELEAARRYVRWARGTTHNVMSTRRGGNPNATVRAAAVNSARRYAPGLLRPSDRRRRRRGGHVHYGYSDPWAGAGIYDGDGSNDSTMNDASGRWVRQGTRIVLLDV